MDIFLSFLLLFSELYATIYLKYYDMGDIMKNRHIIKLACGAAVSLLIAAQPFTSAFAQNAVPDTMQYGALVNEKLEAKEIELHYEDIPVSEFRVDDLSPDIDTDLDYTNWFFSKWDDSRYIFLPSTADRSSLVITYTADDTLYLNDIEVKSGEKTSLLSEADVFKVRVGDTEYGELKIMQSNTGCIYLSTKTGGLDVLDSMPGYKDYSEKDGKILMLNAEGKTEYSGEFEKLSHHGNSSWDYSKMKPYNLKLHKKADLYGMGKAKKWILLSNYIDHSMLRNKVSEEMAKAAGVEYAGDSVFVDLYADGSYRGTYQLCERVQIQKNRVNITDLEEETEKLNEHDLDEYPHMVEGAQKVSDYMENSYKYYDIPNDPEDITGGYLMQLQQWNRYGSKADSGFVTARGQAVQIDGPEYASKAQVEYIRGFVQDMEDALYSDTGYNSKGRHYTDYIDMESMMKAYIIEEVTMNIDATFSSFYFWKDSDITGDGKIHFGPPWDYDLAYGNFSQSRLNADGVRSNSMQTNKLYAAYFPIHGYDDGGVSSSSGSGRPTVGISWLGQLYKQNTYVRRVANTFFEHFEPFLSDLVYGDIPYIVEMAESIKPSAEMSNAEWHTYGGRDYTVLGSASGKDFMDSVDILRQFISKRTKWLSELWKPMTYIEGDINEDGEVNIADVVLLQKYLLGNSPLEVNNWTAADLNGNYKLDVYDLRLLKQLLFS